MDPVPNTKVPTWTPSPTKSPAVRSPAVESDGRDHVPAKFPFSSHHEDGPGGNYLEVEMGHQPAVDDKAAVFLTWKDLSVVVAAAGGGGRRQILDGLTGYAEAAVPLAIMGPSGSGKSTLLDALAGRLGSRTQQMGEILINGRKETLAYGTSAYVTQDDTLMKTLTVREAVYYSARLQLPDSMSAADKTQRADTTIAEMGLHGSADTRIGSGLSGGEKRRVSICIELLRRPELLFLDEPTSGLDSAASYHVISRILRLARRHRIAVVASVHQPSGEVFRLFRNVCLLSGGKTVYFGEVCAAEEFFSLNGFPSPTFMNPADHYLQTINKDFDLQDIEKGDVDGPSKTEEAIIVLVSSYKSSTIRQRTEQHVNYLCQQKRGEGLGKKGGEASFINQSMVLTSRSFVNMYRDLGYYWLRLAIYIALCLCVGTIFYDVGFSFGSIQIFGRERLNGHYGVGAFVIGNTISSIPYLFLISLIPGSIAYFLVGLQRTFEHFAYFVLLLFVTMMLVESLMMTVASIVPDFLLGIITGAGIQGVMMLNGGFFRLPHDLPSPFWRYPMYYIAFHKYANQGFYKNEFEGLVFGDQMGGNGVVSGEEVLRRIWQVEMGYSKWVDLGVLMGMVVVYRVMFLGIVKVVEKVKPMLKRSG
ncbi:ABC transporter G family member 1 [Linum perenne]